MHFSEVAEVLSEALPLAPPTGAKARPNVAEFSVTELSAAIKRSLEGGFGHVRIRGEISGYRGQHASGHCYFALKDENAKIEAVIWRGAYSALRFKPEEGMEVIATGRVTTFPGSSKYQIVIESLEPAGAGALMAVLEERKRKLAAEGLFEASRKRKLPFLPRVVGIVTSPTGAVIRDMLHGFNERFPTHVIVWPVPVQGPTSAPAVAAAIRGFNALTAASPVPRPDLLIVARGGGSLEDLWGFNEEVVVRAAAESRIPLISAVGHETDWTLIDLVADARAPTPTKAAEWAVPKRSDLQVQIADLSNRHVTGTKRLIERERVRLKAAARGIPRAQDLLALPRQRFDTAAGRLPRALIATTQILAARFGRIGGRLGPQALTSRLARARDRVNALANTVDRAFSARVARHGTRLARIGDRLQPRLILVRRSQAVARLGELGERSQRAVARLLTHQQRRLGSQAQMLVSLSYRSTLTRGFAIVRNATGQTVRSKEQIQAGDRLDVELADGHVTAIAGADGTTAIASPKAKPGPASPSRQGTLF